MHRRFQSLALILGLRYRLLLAQARLSNGKFTLYFIGCLLFVLAAVFLQTGGASAAAASLRSETAELATGILLLTAYANAVLIAVLLGVGLNQVFTDEALRRYPVPRRERFAARQILSFLEPLWLLMLTLYCGMAIGFSLPGPAPLWIAGPAAVLLAACNYLTARILAMLIERILAMKHGPQILLAAVMLLFLLPSLLVRIDWGGGGFRQDALPLLRWIPPFAAAAAITGKFPPQGAGWTLYLLACCIAMAAAVFRLDRLPQSSHDNNGERLHPEQPRAHGICDRIAALFHGDIAPLIGKTLRYYVRSPQLRFNYLAALVLIVPLNLSLGGREDGARSFTLALGCISIAGYLSTGMMTANVFGFDGAGLRRYFLLPVSAQSILKATAVVPLLLGSMVIPIAISLWLAVTPAPVDRRMILMLASCGFAGLLLFQSLGTWCSLLAPRAVPFKATFGNKLSFAANALMTGSILVLFFLPQLLDSIGVRTILDFWWIAPALLPGAAVLYMGTLRAGAAVFTSRRERMLAAIERGC
ncbi:MAG: hypothetical protein JW793_07480 [Acidobacteria bacterium]|nr:hypothetical protein [Acidobacteriota bacterium]